MARSRAPRVLRGATAASVATFVALMSHVGGGGELPGWLGVAVPWVLAVMVCTVLAGRSLSVVRLSLAVAVSQALFHVLFVLGSSSTGTGATAQHHGPDLAALSGVAAATGPLDGDALMWTAHAAAAAMTIAIIYRGERAMVVLLRLAGQTARALRRRAIPVLSSPAPSARPLMGAFVAHRALLPLGWHPDTLARRGPPLLSVV